MMKDEKILTIKDKDLGDVAGGSGGELVRYPVDEKCRECGSDNLQITHKGGGRFRIKCNDCKAAYTISVE